MIYGHHHPTAQQFGHLGTHYICYSRGQSLKDNTSPTFFLIINIESMRCLYKYHKYFFLFFWKRVILISLSQANGTGITWLTLAHETVPSNPPLIPLVFMYETLTDTLLYCLRRFIHYHHLLLCFSPSVL
jgi:hypothetical protein